jgi:hypothetical protein
VAAIVISAHCNYCGKQRPPADVFHWAGGTRICADCLVWHRAAVELLFSGKPPNECQGCRKTLAQLELECPQGDIGMYVHGPVDGIYQVFCSVCSEAIRSKQKDRYRGTAFGHEKGL